MPRTDKLFDKRKQRKECMLFNQNIVKEQKQNSKASLFC